MRTLFSGIWCCLLKESEKICGDEREGLQEDIEDRKDMEVQLQSKSSGVKKQWFLGSIVHSANKQKAFRTLNKNYNQ